MSTRARRTVAICAGIVAAAAVLAWLYPTHFSPEARMAEALGYSPSDYLSVHDLSRAALAQRRLTPDQWVRLRELAAASDWRIQARALSLLPHLSGQAPLAIALARPYLTSKRPVLRATALVALVRLGAPDARQQVATLELDPSDTVRQIARDQIGRLGGGNGGQP